MEKPILSPDFTVEDIHRLREYNYEQTKALSTKEQLHYYNDIGMEIHRMIQKKKNLSDV